MAQTRLARRAIDPHQGRSGPTHTSPSQDKEEEEDGLDLVVEGEIDYEWVYCTFVRRNATLSGEGIGTIRTCGQKRSVQQGIVPVKTYPDGPNGHDTLHITLALGYRPGAGLATITCGGSGGLEDLVGVVDVEEEVGETKDWDDGAHLVGLTTAVSPIKITLYACRNRAEEPGRGCMEVVVVGRGEKRWDAVLE